MELLEKEGASQVNRSESEDKAYDHVEVHISHKTRVHLWQNDNFKVGKHGVGGRCVHFLLHLEK